MQFGYIKINGKIVKIFLNKADKDVQEECLMLRDQMKHLDVAVEWNNCSTNKNMDQVLAFMGIEE